MSKTEQIILEIKVNNREGLIEIGKHQVALEELRAKQAQYRQELKNGIGDKDEYRVSINETTQAIKAEQDAIRMLSKDIQNNIKQETAQVGSIDGMKASLSKLTAQYNALSAAERKGEAGDKIKNEIVVIDQALKAEEQSLGNFRRQVGNYEVATKSIRAELKELTEQIIQMKLAGKEGTDEFEAIMKRASEVRDAYGDAQREINVGASDTKGLDRMKGAVDAMAGSFTMLNSVQGVFTSDQEEMNEIVQKVQIGIGALSAGIALQNTLQKEGIVMNTIITLQSKAKTAALAMETKGTVAATLAQRIFNAVANANPYVLLAVALATVVGALWAFASGSETAAEKQEKLNEKTRIAADYLDYEMKKLEDVSQARIKAAENALVLAKAQGASAKDIEELEQGIYLAKKIRATGLAKLASDEVKNIDANVSQMDYLQAKLKELKQDQANGNTDYKPSLVIDGKAMYFEFEEALTECQNQIDITGKAIEVGTKVKLDVQTIEDDEKVRLAAKAKADSDTAASNAKDRRQKELSEVRAAQDAVFALLKDSQDKEVAEVEAKSKRQIEDLNAKLQQETNLTVWAKQAIATQIKAIEEKQVQDIAKINETFSRAKFDKELAEQELIIATRLARAKEGSQTQFDAQMQSIETQMQAEIEANSRKIETEQIEESLIRDKYAAMREQTTKDRDKSIADQELERAKLNVENVLLQTQLDGGNELQAKLDAKQAELDALAQLEGESDEAFLNRKLKMASEEKAIIKDIADAKQRQLEDTLTAFGGLAGSLGQIFEQMGEDNEAMAVFSKALALVELGINTAKAISAGVASAAGVAFPGNIIAIASTVAAVVANIAQATQILNKQKTPKAPKVNKYATGGVIEGPGSGTSDSVPAMLSNGESVLTALTTSMFAPILSSFNQIGGGVPIQVVNSSAQVLGEEMLARAFAKGAAMLPPPVVSVQEVTDTQARLAKIEELRRF